MTHSNITPFVEQVYCWIIYSDVLQFLEHAYFFIIFFLAIFGETFVSFLFRMENFIHFSI